MNSNNQSSIKTYRALKSEVPKMTLFVKKTLEQSSIDILIINDIILAFDEAATNIIMHAYNGLEFIESKTVDVHIEIDTNKIHIVLKDNGKFFDGTGIPLPDLKENMKGNRKGGFGIYIMKSLMDKIHYQRINNYNITTLIKNINTVDMG